MLYDLDVQPNLTCETLQNIQEEWMDTFFFFFQIATATLDAFFFSLVRHCED